MVVGIDFVGPLYFKTQGEQVTSKGVLVHHLYVESSALRVVLDMSAQAFI